MKITHVFRNVNEDPGLATLVTEDSNNEPYIPSGAVTLANGSQSWEGRDVYVSTCAGCAALEAPCAQRMLLRDLDMLVVHEIDPPAAKP
jgi:hypothetical protein